MEKQVFTLTKNQNGQTLAVMLILMLLSLSLGITISNRFIKSLRSTTRVQANYRAQAVAEAAVERILIKDVEELINYIEFGNCGLDCFYQITNDDGVIETATIELSYLGNSSDPYVMQLAQNQPNELVLTGYPNNQNISVCWDNPSGTPPSVTGYMVYGTSGNYQMNSFARNSSGSTVSNGFDTTTGGSGFDSCFSVNTQTNPVMLRMRSLYQDLEVTVIPAASTTLPSQGILIESTGQVMDSTKKLSVIKGNNLVPLDFDFVLFQRSATEALHN